MNANIIDKQYMRIAHRNVELSHAEAVKLTAMAECIVVSNDETPSGYLLMYNDGVVRQYDPVSNTIVGAFDERHEHGGWIS